MKYYYTDPLAAAWMAKHFGMRFVDKAGHSVSVDPSMWYMAERHYQAGSLHIHPDNLHLLEPQSGDLVLGKIKGEWTLSEGAAPHLKDYPGKIIQRNGTPFMWPESEK